MNREDREREMQRWRAFPRVRPAHVAPPGPGQVSVWDFPRPPRVERVSRRLRVGFGGTCLVDTDGGQRVVETAGAPVYYVPLAAVRDGALVPQARRSLCEWKGEARYFDVRAGGRCAEAAAFTFPDPEPGFAALRDCVAFYAAPMDACFVGDERVTPQPGGFYAGWVTRDLVGPIKGEPGSEAW